MLEALSIPERILAPVIMPGTKTGAFRGELSRELGVRPIDVITVAGHDTQSAMAAVPTQEEDFIFISCGTWSLFGTELSSPVIHDKSFACNMTNEGGCCGKISFLKNIIGLWLIQESRRQWMREGAEYSFGELEEMAKKSAPFKAFIDADAPSLL